MARREGPLLVGFVAAAFATALLLLNVLDPAEEAFYDRVSSHLPEPGGMPETVVVAIDDPSFAEIGLAWPWPRALHASLIQSLRQAGAHSIGYDVVFADPGSPEDDASLAAALGTDVILARYNSQIDTPQGMISMAVSPIAGFAGRARVASVDLPVDTDGAIRRLSSDPEAMATVMSKRQPPSDARIRFNDAGLTTVSFYQALAAGRMLPPETFWDKAVFVGAVLGSAPGTAAESFRVPATATGAGFLAGVKIHAHAYRTLTGGTWFEPVPRAFPPLLALLFAVSTALVSAGRPAITVVSATVMLSAVPLAGSAGLLVAGYWLPPVAPALAGLAAGIGQTVFDYARARRARAEVIRSFGQYLAPEVVRRLVEYPETLRLGGERREVTILFCDLRGFTTLSERMKDRPELLTRWLNEAMDILARAVVDNGGMVDKFIGDCVMALWNAPADDPEHAAHAIAAGRAMVDGIERLSQRIKAEGHDVTLACGVGINTGDCTVGNMGSSLRFDYTAIGDPVNLASRLEGLTKTFGTPILIGSATAARLDGVGLLALGPAIVKGRSGAEEVFTVSDFGSEPA